MSENLLQWRAKKDLFLQLCEARDARLFVDSNLFCWRTHQQKKKKKGYLICFYVDPRFGEYFG